MRRLRKFIGTITGSRWRRWERACFIHESNRWDGLHREASRKFRERSRFADQKERQAAFNELMGFVHGRMFYGCQWMGPRPSAP
jgi:hypothetical protein